MIYYIYYHSSNPSQLNQKVLDSVKEFPGWAILSPSFFLVRLNDIEGNSNRDANLFEIKNKIRLVCDQDDEFFIGQMGDESTWQGYGSKLRDWLLKNTIKDKEKKEEDFSSSEAAKAVLDTLLKAKQKEDQTEYVVQARTLNTHSDVKENADFEEVR